MLSLVQHIMRVAWQACSFYAGEWVSSEFKSDGLKSVAQHDAATPVCAHFRVTVNKISLKFVLVT